jgi:hypothetical protein
MKGLVVEDKATRVYQYVEENGWNRRISSEGFWGEGSGE